MNAAFTGRKRSGKTTLAFDMAMRNEGGILIYDPKREWRGWPGTVSDVLEIEKKIKDKHEVIVFHPNGDKRAAFEPLADYVTALHTTAMLKNWDKIGYHFTFIVDEAVNVSTAHFVDNKLLALVAENRPEILSIYLTFQSPMDINNLLKSRISDYFVFNTSLPRDLDYLSKEIGVPKRDLDEIQHLQPHEFAHFFFDGGKPSVEYVYEPEEWFRPLEYFELNKKEREEEIMSDRRKDASLSDLLDEAKDLFDEIFDHPDYKPARRRSRRDDSDDRDDRGRGRGRERASRYEGY